MMCGAGASGLRPWWSPLWRRGGWRTPGVWRVHGATDRGGRLSVRAGLTYAAVAAAGAALFFMSFGAISPGSGPLLVFSLLGYAGPGPGAVRFGAAPPGTL